MIELISQNKYINENLKRIVFVIDTAPTHSKDKLHKLYKKINLIILSPQSSDMNPIELLFNQVKRKLMREETRVNFSDDFVR